MKLQKKKLTNIKVLGEIVPCDEYGCIAVKTEQGVVWYYRSLAELNEEWEDYEEPKEYWCIDWTGGVNHITLLDDSTDEYEKDKIQIGNYFDTREEAEKAVEKLKAWKRLKGVIVGWSFSYNLDLNGCSFDDEDIVVGIKLPRNTSEKDLDLLFGGEE